MIERSFDSDKIKSIVLHESMGNSLRYLKNTIDEIVNDDRNYCFVDDLRTCVFVRSNVDPYASYSIIVAMMPDGREAGSIEFIRKCVDTMLDMGAKVTCNVASSNTSAVNMISAIKRGVVFNRTENIVYGFCTAETAKLEREQYP